MLTFTFTFMKPRFHLLAPLLNDQIWPFYTRKQNLFFSNFISFSRYVTVYSKTSSFMVRLIHENYFTQFLSVHFVILEIATLNLMLIVCYLSQKQLFEVSLIKKSGFTQSETTTLLRNLTGRESQHKT